MREEDDVVLAANVFDYLAGELGIAFCFSHCRTLFGCWEQQRATLYALPSRTFDAEPTHMDHQIQALVVAHDGPIHSPSICWEIFATHAASRGYCSSMPRKPFTQLLSRTSPE